MKLFDYCQARVSDWCAVSRAQLKFVKIPPPHFFAGNVAYVIGDVIEKDSIIDWTTLLLTLTSMILFFGLNYKVNNTPVDDLNVYPNYLYVYAVQLIAFQVSSLFILMTLYARHKKLFKTLFTELKGAFS